MSLADKIIELRKKQGWSQIDLADRLDVSRQSVSKWEMAQAVPELDKIIKMSELFSVTTDYLLKDDIPGPDQTDATPPPPPEQPPAPEPEPDKQAPPATEEKRPRRKKWPWILAACLLVFVVIPTVLAVVGYARFTTEQTSVSVIRELEQVEPTPTPAPMPADGAVVEEPVAQEAVTGEAGQPAMQSFAYEGDAVTGGGIDAAELTAIAAEYEPYGIAYADGQWYIDGEPIRVFTDVLTSNGESLTGGHFQGTIRNWAGQGEIDVRTVRDFEHCDEHGNGTLLYVEACDIRREDAVWTEHHAEEHDGEEEHHTELHHD